MTSYDISFTLDTICPWTYLAKRRLDIGWFPAHASNTGTLDRFRETEEGKNVKFVVKYMPYQLYPEQSQEPQSKQEFYKTTLYAQTEEKFKMYSTYMSALGVGVGIDFSFGGLVSNTLHAHRLIQYYQEEKGPETSEKIVRSLYTQYFENEKSPSADETLVKAAIDAGITEAEARAFVKDKNEYLMDTKMALREQIGNGVDAVPYIIFEGKRRDFTLQGAKEIEEYEQTLARIVKESR